MQGYENKEALIAEIEKTAELFIGEFEGIEETDKDRLVEGVDRTPAQMLAYQLGWMSLLRGWDQDELAGKPVVTPAQGYKWNDMGGLYQSFYGIYQDCSLELLRQLFREGVQELVNWVDGLSDAVLFQPGGRKWATSTPSCWPVWKWIHMNTVAPFKSFRSKIRKWKKEIASPT